MPSFESIEEDFLRISAEVAWATVATVDSKGRPRPRILHPYWEVVDGRPVGWVGTSRSPMKSKHLAASPFVSGRVLVPEAGDRARGVPRVMGRRGARAPLGALPRGGPAARLRPGDMAPWKDGRLGGVFAALRLDPWRVMVLTSGDVAGGRFYERYWRDGE